MDNKRDQWGTKLGFILAAVGSAVGLGNIWRFPYLVYENGGGAFLVPYFFAIFTAGIPLLILEYGMGHKFRGSTPLAMARGNKKWEWLGWWPSITAFFILGYYSMILSWAMKYFTLSFNKGWGSDPNTYFYDDFLKLLSAEMQYQDPLEPTSNTDYVAQMATFSQLEATLSMKESMSSSYDQTTKSAALSLVGKEVIVTDKDSASGYYSGKVDYVTYKDGKIQLSINEKMYDYSSLYSVSTDEYYDAIVNSSTFSSLIAKLPKIENLTIDSKGSIEEARKLYDGLSDYGKQFINASDYSKLQAYEDKLKELIAADKNNQADSKENDTNQTA